MDVRLSVGCLVGHSQLVSHHFLKRQGCAQLRSYYAPITCVKHNFGTTLTTLFCTAHTLVKHLGTSLTTYFVQPTPLLNTPWGRFDNFIAAFQLYDGH